MSDPIPFPPSTKEIPPGPAAPVPGVKVIYRGHNEAGAVQDMLAQVLLVHSPTVIDVHIYNGRIQGDRTVNNQTVPNTERRNVPLIDRTHADVVGWFWPEE